MSAIKKIPQPHGGSLNSGGTPGNKGGRLPNALRDRLREGLEAAIPSIIKAAQDEDHPDHKWAADFCGKYGLGLRHELEVEQPTVTLNVEELREQLLARHARIRALPSGDNSDD